MSIGCALGTMMEAFRKGIAGHVVSWLCIGVFFAMLVTPVVVASAGQSVIEAIAASICYANPDDDEGAGERSVGPQCPFCPIGGAVWTLHSRLPLLVRLAIEAEIRIPPTECDRPTLVPSTIRPAPRAPPVAV